MEQTKQGELPEEVIEELADIEHQKWSSWMSYLFDKCGNPKIGEDAVIPAEFADRWARQMNTDYADLTKQEKESDRDQVRKYLPIIAQAQQEALEPWTATVANGFYPIEINFRTKKRSRSMD